VRATDGRVLWTRGVQNGDHSSPAVAGGRVFVSYACRQTYSFTLAGAPAWHYSGPCSGGGGRTPVVHGGRVYVRDFSDLVLSAVTGTLVDTFSADAAPAFSGTTGLFVADGVMRAQRTTTGVGLWTFAGDRRLVSAPIVANGYAYVASASGRVYAVRLTTGIGRLIGITPAPVLAPDEHNARILTGIAGGGGQLLVPASGTITAYH
jgi:outer membrane protein assembly factor BamB